MKKLNLFAVKRKEERAELIIEKSQAFVSLIRKIIKKQDLNWKKRKPWHISTKTHG
ncbi:MAG: hypothetical protein Q7S74_00700 [Nanoarchaeota archaeon]|nr:hypothetical protein [Nanoarchaeota archaeon]